MSSKAWTPAFEGFFMELEEKLAKKYGAECLESDKVQEHIFLKACEMIRHFVVVCETTTSYEQLRDALIELDHAEWEEWAPTIGRKRYEQLRDALIELGHAEWVNADDHSQGWRLTRPASEILKAIFEIRFH